MSIGESLADARVRAGLTVGQVSQQTRIRESIIRDIEQGDFDACGGDFYARGHIRSIAGAVGTDPVPLISEYDADHGPVGPLQAAEVFGPAKPIKIRERRSPSLAMIVVLVLLAIIGYTGYRLVSGHGKSGGQPAVAAAATTTPPATPKPRATPTPSATPSDVVIKIAASEECWVELTSTHSGSQLYMGVIEAGNSMTWTEKQAVSLRLGNPGGIVLTVDGQQHAISTALPVTLNLSPQAGSSVSTPDGVPSGSQAG
jgi:cytoskeletal protein RodZ